MNGYHIITSNLVGGFLFKSKVNGNHNRLSLILIVSKLH